MSYVSVICIRVTQKAALQVAAHRDLTADANQLFTDDAIHYD